MIPSPLDLDAIEEQIQNAESTKDFIWLVHEKMPALIARLRSLESQPPPAKGGTPAEAGRWTRSRTDIQSYDADGDPVVYLYPPDESQERIGIRGGDCQATADRLLAALNIPPSAKAPKARAEVVALVEEIIVDAVTWYIQHFPRQELGDMGGEAFGKFADRIIELVHPPALPAALAPSEPLRWTKEKPETWYKYRWADEPEKEYTIKVGCHAWNNTDAIRNKGRVIEFAGPIAEPIQGKGGAQ